MACYEGFLLLLGLRWHDRYGEPAPFSWRFCAVWCGLTEYEARTGIRWLFKEGYLDTADEFRGSFGKTMSLFMPTVPEAFIGFMAAEGREVA